jgi:phthalate 4,5-cis-dihydrodiol dehydrogenase
MRQRPLRIGIIGLGFASTYTIPALAANERVAISAASDLRPTAREHFERQFGGETFERVADLCANPNVDAVYISTPPELHAEHAIAAAEAGKHIIVEKPMAITQEQCEAMIAAADRAGVVLMVGHTHAYDPPIRAMRSLVKSGGLGPLAMMHTWNYTDLFYRARTAWEMDTARGGGVVWVQAPHQVDILRLIGGGLVRSVRAMTGAWEETRPTEGNLVAYLELEDGTPATLVYSGYAHFDTGELHYWIGERGQPRDPASHAKSQAEYVARLEAGVDEESLREARRYGGNAVPSETHAGLHQHQHFFGLTVVSCQHADLRQSPYGLSMYGPEGKQEIEVEGDPSGFTTMIDEFCDAVVFKTAPLHDGAWGAATVEVCLALLQSARERREIMLTHQSPVHD